MLSLAVRNFSARKLRALSTALAVFFGVAMISGTLLLTDSVDRAFDDLFASANESIDVTVRAKLAVEGDFGEDFTRPLDEALVDRIGAIDGVDRAIGSVTEDTISIVDEDGDRIGAMGPPHILFSAPPPDPPFEPFSIVDGSHPAGASEAAIDTDTAENEGYEIGDTIRVAGSAGESEYTLVGIGEFGSGQSLGASLVELTLEEAQRLSDQVGKVNEIDVAGADGTTPEQLAQRIGAELGTDRYEIRTGAETASEDAGDIQEGFGFLSTALLVFAGIAVFVGAFLIFNTFSITVAQRAREFAMLRTLGASSRQIMVAVLVEAALVGLLASILGIAGGFGFVVLVKGLFELMGFSLPTSSLALTPSIVAISLAVGIVTTLVAALSPARRATRVAPLEALTETAGGAVGGEERRSRRRTVIATVLIAVAVPLLAFGMFGGGDFEDALPLLGLALVLLFIGLAMIGDRFVAPFASALGMPLERLRGITGKLARENAQRQPARTASTAAALMIGVALVTFVGVFASSIRDSLGSNLDRQFVGDVAIVNTDGFSPISARIADEVAAVEGVGVVSPTALLPTRIDPGADEVLVNGIDPATLPDVVELDWAEGSDEILAGLGADEAVIDEKYAEKHDLEVGDELAILGPSGDRVDAAVAGITTRSRFVVNEVAIPREVVRGALGASQDTTTFVNFAAGADPEATRAAIDGLLSERFPNAEARSQAEFKSDRQGEIDQLIALIYVLLGLSVLISIFGVVNTLSLTIFERTRELGMLRAIGTSRSQVRRMIRYESIVTALLGATVGAVIGLALGIGAVTALEDEGLSLAVSPSLPITVLVAAIVIGIVAAIAPARRASRVDVIEALQYE